MTVAYTAHTSHIHVDYLCGNLADIFEIEFEIILDSFKILC